MNIGKEDLIRINKGFDGILMNNALLDFAIEKQQYFKLGEYKKLAYLFRAILVDHLFSGGNKRTAMFLAFSFAEAYGKTVDHDLLKHQIQSISAKNITEIRNIAWRLKNAIK